MQPPIHLSFANNFLQETRWRPDQGLPCEAVPMPFLHEEVHRGGFRFVEV